MTDFLKRLFAADFMPHGHCYFWQPEIVWLHVPSDGLITLAYYSSAAAPRRWAGPWSRPSFRRSTATLFYWIGSSANPICLRWDVQLRPRGQQRRPQAGRLR